MERQVLMIDNYDSFTYNLVHYLEDLDCEVNSDLPDSLEATSFDENGQVMSLRHKEFDIRAVQFHPESVLTPQGKQILKNWLEK